MVYIRECTCMYTCSRTRVRTSERQKEMLYLSEKTSLPTCTGVPSLSTLPLNESFLTSASADIFLDKLHYVFCLRCWHPAKNKLKEKLFAKLHFVKFIIYQELDKLREKKRDSEISLIHIPGLQLD